MNMKKKLLQRLHEILIEIAKADEAELNKIGAELVDIEKKLMLYVEPKDKKKIDF